MTTLAEEKTMHALVRNWWMMAVRGELAILFGVAVLFWPNVMLSTLVMLFGTYAILDGVWTVAAAVRVSPRRLAAWPVGLEGLVSVVVGLLAVAVPFLSRGFVSVLVLWGIATGVLELVAAAWLPRDAAGQWLLATAGTSSLFLAVAVIILRHALVVEIATLLALYALLFGVVLTGAALRFRQTHARVLRSPVGLATARSK